MKLCADDFGNEKARGKVQTKKGGERMEEKKYSTDCGCRDGKHLKGVNCDAKNCAFNDGEHQCCAGRINVGPRDADCSSDTICATFKPKAY